MNPKAIGACLLVLLLAVPAIPAQNDTQPQPTGKLWTFIIFMYADTNQHGVPISQYTMVGDLETNGGWSDENMNILVFIDRAPGHPPDADAHFYYIKNGNADEIALSRINGSWVREVNMADPQTIADVGIYAIQNYPAQHYAVVTRSAGWWPDNFGEDITMPDGTIQWANTNVYTMRTAIHRMADAAGKKIDVLAICGCTSGAFEWAYDFAPFVDYYVGTETYSIGDHWRVYNWLSALKQDPTMSPEQFVKIPVAEYSNTTRPGFNINDSMTASATNLTRLPATAAALDALALALKDNLIVNLRSIIKARDQIASIDWYLRVDMWEMARQMSIQFPRGTDIGDKARALMSCIDNMTVANTWYNSWNGYGINVSTSHDLSIFFIYDPAAYWANCVNSYRTELRASIELHWIDFLDAYFSPSIMHYHTRFPVGNPQIYMWGGGWDLDGDGNSDDVYMYVYDAEGQGLGGATIYANGVFWGKTRSDGVFYGFNVQSGLYTIMAELSGCYASCQIYVYPVVTSWHIQMDVIVDDMDSQGSKDDIHVDLHLADGTPLGWQNLYSDRGYEGYTDDRGHYVTNDFSEGLHLLYCYVWGYYLTYASFYSEGGGGAIHVDPKVVDYANDGQVNDLDLTVLDQYGNALDGAAVYVDDHYCGLTGNGRLVRQDLNYTWHDLDIYYEAPEPERAARFGDVYVRYADLDGDGYEETLQVYYTVIPEDPAKDVRVTLQVINPFKLTLDALYCDNFTATKLQNGPRVFSFSANQSRYVQFRLTLMDTKDYVLDTWERTGYYIDAPKLAKPVGRLFVRPSTATPWQTVEFNATTSTDATANITQYCFYFGDGTSTGWISDSVVSHAYADLGNYTAFVKVRDARGMEDDLSNQITVYVKAAATVKPGPGPTARFFVRPLYTYPWDTVDFNGSISEAAVGQVTEYLFDFGDGTTTGWVRTPEVSHSYDTPGNYTAKLLVMDDSGVVSAKSAWQTVWVREVVNSPPHASFTLTPSKTGINTTVTFNATGSSDKDGMVFRYLFDFGDGTDSGWVFDGIMTHIYTVAGNYTARVMVEDDLGARSNWSTTHTVQILGNQAPRPYLFVRPYTAAPGQYLTFNATGSVDPDGSVVEYYFDFGDGTSSGWTSLAVVQHSYAVCGTYIVQLLVKDNQGEVSHSAAKTSLDIKNAAPKLTTVTVGDPNISAAVITLFVVIMIAGAFYETRQRRRAERAAAAEHVQDYPPADGSAGQPAMPPEAAWVQPVAGPPGAPPPVASAEPLGYSEQYQETSSQSGQSTIAPPAYALPEPLSTTCTGCGNVMTVPDGPRPIRVTCDSCGKAGVLR